MVAGDYRKLFIFSHSSRNRPRYRVALFEVSIPITFIVLAKRLCSYFGSRVEDVLEEGKVEKLLHVRGSKSIIILSILHTCLC